MPGSDMFARRIAMLALVVEKDVRAEVGQKGTLVHSAEEQRLVDANVPAAQRADQRGVRAVGRLDAMKRGEEGFERAAGQRRITGGDLVEVEESAGRDGDYTI